MRSKELALEFGCDDSWVRKLTKKAVESGKNFITLKDQKVVFKEIIGRGGSSGRVYEYILPKERGKKETSECKQSGACDIAKD